MIAFLKASTAYSPKPGLKECRVRVRIAVGGKEQPGTLRSARLLQAMLPCSTLEIKEGLHHGEYSINRPEQYAADLVHMMGEE